MTARFLEDFAVGQTYGSGRARIDGDRIKSFAAEFDPQPFHLDEDAARNSIFRGLAASGWHTAALTMRLLVDSEAGGIVGAGFDEFRWPHPVRPGAPIEVASRAGADQGPNHHVQSGRQGCAGAGVEPGCATPDAACRSRRCPMSTPTDEPQGPAAGPRRPFGRDENRRHRGTSPRRELTRGR